MVRLSVNKTAASAIVILPGTTQRDFGFTLKNSKVYYTIYNRVMEYDLYLL